MIVIPRYPGERYPPGADDVRWLRIGGRDGDLYDEALAYDRSWWRWLVAVFS